MPRKLIILLTAFLLYSPCTKANEAIMSSVPNASVVGRAVLSYVFWDIYEATLYAPKGRYDPAQPFALSIEYFHEIDGKDIADKSVQEMRKQGFGDEIKLATWNAQLKTIFPDVKNGTVLSAVYIPGRQTNFFNGDQAIGAIKGDDFGTLFFGIWLNEHTSAPELRRALLGLS